MFDPIKTSYYDPEPNIERITHEEESRIRDLLIGRRVVEVSGEQCKLDDGTVLCIVPNEGCGGCPSGYYELEHLQSVDNAIMSVEFDTEELSEHGEDLAYRVFVFADAERINLYTVSGSDGNGYYGTGYHILVRPAPPEPPAPTDGLGRAFV